MSDRQICITCFGHIPSFAIERIVVLMISFYLYICVLFVFDVKVILYIITRKQVEIWTNPFRSIYKTKHQNVIIPFLWIARTKHKDETDRPIPLEWNHAITFHFVLEPNTPSMSPIQMCCSLCITKNSRRLSRNESSKQNWSQWKQKDIVMYLWEWWWFSFLLCVIPMPISLLMNNI